jgi:hypothetical protein
MHFILVTYGFNRKKQERWKRFLSHFPTSTSLVVENGDFHPHEEFNLIKGSNAQYEFSGYREGLRAVNGLTETTIVVNDTLFSHHWEWGWAKLTQLALALPSGIYGDYRCEPIFWNGKPLQIFASWYFVLRGSHAQSEFLRYLDDVIESFEVPLHFEGYQEYLAHYLQGNMVHGYTKSQKKPANPSLALKVKCIYAEHRLGRLLDTSGWVVPFPHWTYRWLHWVDRFLSFRTRTFNVLGFARTP